MPASKGNRGRKFVAVDNTLRQPKIVAPPEASSTGRKIWNKLVDSTPNEHFTISDYPVLLSYCEATATLIRARKKLVSTGGEVIINSKGDLVKNPWFTVMQESIGRIATLCTKLRLCPVSRMKNETVSTKPTAAAPTTTLGNLIKR